MKCCLFQIGSLKQKGIFMLILSQVLKIFSMHVHVNQFTTIRPGVLIMNRCSFTLQAYTINVSISTQFLSMHYMH